MSGPAQLLGIFERPGDAAAAVREIRDRRFGELEVFAPIPDHELLEAAERPRSRVRFFTLVGGLTGLVGGLALALWSSTIFNLVVGGKPPTAVPPYIIVGFELTILLGGLATLVGLLLTARLPRFRAPALWDERLSEDRYGVAVACKENAADQLAELLTRCGAEEVRRG